MEKGEFNLRFFVLKMQSHTQFYVNASFEALISHRIKVEPSIICIKITTFLHSSPCIQAKNGNNVLQIQLSLLAPCLMLSYHALCHDSTVQLIAQRHEHLGATSESFHGV